MSGAVLKPRLGPLSSASVCCTKLQRPSRYSTRLIRRSQPALCRSTPGGPENQRQTGLLHQFRSEATRFTERYDILSTGAGALVCTSFFWSRGQDPIEALWITFCATIVGLVVNELASKDDM